MQKLTLSSTLPISAIRSRFGLFRLAFLFAFLSASLGFATTLSAQILINELDADTVGTDALEFVELYDGGTGNSALDGMVLVFYNGSNNLSYAAYDLDGFSTDANGYFLAGNAAVSPAPSIVFGSNGLQNGADGVALYTANAADFPNGSVVSISNLLDAVVYDTNDNDAVGLLVLLNAGEPQVNEGGGGDKDGQSNQRCANGSGGARNTSTYGQFAPTPGAANCAASPPPPPADVIINELDADTTGTDTLEFVELYDGGAGNSALDGMVLVFYNGGGTDKSYAAYDLDGFSTDANGYFLLGNAAVLPAPSIVFGSNGLQNGADGVALYTGDATDFPSGSAVTTSNLLDAVVYDTNDSDDLELLVLLNPGEPQVNEGGSGDKDGHSNQRCANGSGGARNTSTYGQFTPTPGASNCVTAPVDGVLINELDADTAGTDALEFVELYDGGTGNSALDGMVLVFYNGNGDSSYAAYDLDGYSTDANGYFLLGNAAVLPTPSIVFGSNGLQNGADGIALYTGDATDFPSGTLVSTNNLLDAAVYDTSDSDDAGLLVLLNPGEPQVNENGGGDKDNQSNQRCENGSGGARNTSTYGQFTPTPGAGNCGAPPPPVAEVCGDPTTLVHDIQGSGAASPIFGTAVSIEAIVVGDFQNGPAGTDGDLSGFFVQEEDADADADPSTSEGIFIADGSSPLVDVQSGDMVRVAGTVTESFGLTSLNLLTFVEVCTPAAGLPTATTISLPRSAITDWEVAEGMLVEFPQTLFVSSNFTLGRFGELDLAVEAPLDNPTNVVAPGVAANALQDLNDLSRILLDDGSTAANREPLPPYLDLDGTRRVGDSTTNLTGVLSYGFNNYRLQPTAAVTFVNNNTRPQDPPDVGSSLVTLAGFNVLNYFTTLDGNGSICGPSASFDCRGADNAEEFERQKEKLVAALSTLNADIVGLIELENAVDSTPIADLVEGINVVLGAGTYAHVVTNAIGTDAIRQGIIYKPDSVTPEGAFAILDSTVDPLFNDMRNRPALAQSFSVNNSGETFTVAVNHLKSKGSNCNSTGDTDIGDGQGNCNLTRTDAATALVTWLATDPTLSGNNQSIIIGDLNAYAMEDPISAIISGGHTDLINAFAGIGYTSGAYSFSFQGQAGYLDHALSSPDLLPAISGAAIWHINSDEPVALDYNTEFRQADLYSPGQYRASDHDAVVVGLYPDEDEDGVWDQVDACPNTVIPESVPTQSLGTNRFALVDGDGIFDTKASKGKGPKASFDIIDTAGCSCEQIIEAQGLGKGHTKFGCSIGVMKTWVDMVNQL